MTSVIIMGAFSPHYKMYKCFPKHNSVVPYTSYQVNCKVCDQSCLIYPSSPFHLPLSTYHFPLLPTSPSTQSSREAWGNLLVFQELTITIPFHALLYLFKLCAASFSKASKSHMKITFYELGEFLCQTSDDRL